MSFMTENKTTPEKTKSANSTFISVLMVIGIVLLFGAVFHEAEQSFIAAGSHSKKLTKSF